MIIVSACLAGINCRYDGKNCINDKVLEMISRGRAIPVCPEQLGGLPTPREAMEIEGGGGKDVLEGKCRVLDKKGGDVTENLIRGAKEVLRICKASGVTKAVLKAKSPSCGYGSIYDGTFSGRLAGANGVTAELLRQNGVQVITEEDL